MGYSRNASGLGFRNYVQPYIDMLPTAPGELPLLLQVPSHRGEACAYHWRNYLHATLIKSYYRVSVLPLPSNPSLAQVVIAFKVSEEEDWNVETVQRAKPPQGHSVSRREIAQLVKTTLAPEAPIVTEEGEEVDINEWLKEAAQDTSERNGTCELPEKKEKKEGSTIISKYYGKESKENDDMFRKEE